MACSTDHNFVHYVKGLHRVPHRTFPQLWLFWVLQFGDMDYLSTEQPRTMEDNLDQDNSNILSIHELAVM